MHLPAPVLDLASPELLPWVALAFGLVTGSFANVCIHRLSQDPPQSVVYPPSRCPRCGALIRPWDNVPVLSYAVLLGRCRSCRAPISPRYPLVEAANGAAYWAIASALGPSLRGLLSMAFVTAMLVLALIDLDVHRLPDVITLPGTALGVLGSALTGNPPLLESALSAAGGFLLLAAIAKAGRLYFGEEALGMGDWKMAAMLGAFLGWQGLLLALFLGALLGSVVGLLLIAAGRGGRRTRLPLGTFLSLGAVATLFAGEPLLAWYRGMLHG
jgi:leader peptidase (prepilin peptidase) / N-methyltransferase